MSFKKFLKDIQEETTSADIASVDNKLGSKQKHLEKGKKCKKHKRLNCEACELAEEDRYN